MRKRGLALVLVVGVLGILAVLGSAFAVLSRLERKSASLRAEGTRAYLLARSGLEHAMAVLEAGRDADYRGEDFNANGVLDGVEVSAQVYRTSALDRDACPVRHALRPSLYVEDRLSVSSPKDPALRPVDGKPRGYSGGFGGDRAQWSLKVGSRGGIHVNGGDPALGPGVGYNATLRRMLGFLAWEIDFEEGGIDGLPVSQADGWALVDQRPSTGWTSFEQMRSLALGGSQVKADLLRPYLALEAWTDRHVIRPNPAPNGVRYYAWAEFKKAKLSPGTGLPVPDFERMPVTPGGRNVGRAPVDFQWARSRKPVLVALIGDLRARYLCRSDRGLVAAGFPVGLIREFLYFNVASGGLALQVSDQIVACSSEIETWGQWESFCSDLALPYPETESVPRAKAARAILMANFNPNSDLTKFNLDASRNRLLDKSDLLSYSTELDLRSAAPKTLESCGRVLSPEGRVLAERTLRSDFSSGRTLRLDTQRELLAEDLGDLDLPGDEGPPRLPGFQASGAPDCISESRGTGRTWGHRLDMTAKYPGTWMDGDSGGVSLQSYPEPCTDTQDGSGPRIAPADYDGCLRLATMETAEWADYGVTAATEDLMMLGRYATGLDLDVADGGTPQKFTDAQQVMTSELGNSLLDAAKPNTLYPDGCYSEYQRIPTYYDQGSAHGRHGVISFWFKPDEYYNNRRWRTFVKWTNFQEATYSGVGSPNQFFFLGWAGWDWSSTRPYVEGPFCQFETWRGFDGGHEFQYHTDGVQPPVTGRWTLMTLFYDFEGADHHACGELILDGGGLPGVNVASNDDYQATSSAAATTDITEPDLIGPHRIALGARRGWYDGGTWNTSGSQGNADATFDEFMIYDFGSDESSAAVLAANRYQEGRYYKGSAYSNLGDTYSPAAGQAPSYVTAPLRLPTGAWLKRVSWTFHPGKGLPDDYVEVALVEADGSGYLGGGDPDGSARTRSVKQAGWRRSAQDWTLRREASAPFRLQVVFRRDVPVDEATPILDSPTLDDLTVVYELGRGPRLLSWSRAE